MSEPKTCPYCAEPHPRIDATDNFVAVECQSCGARGPVFGDEETPIEERKESAVRAWNSPRWRR